jgi:glutaredoxin
MSQIIVYTKENCPNCDRLKSGLKEMNLEFDEQEIEKKDAIIDLRCLGCFPREAPVLRIGKTCYESPVLFEKNGGLHPDIVHTISESNDCKSSL